MKTIELAKNRRSRYQLTNEIPLTDQQVLSLVREAVKYAPSAFNSQSTRVLVLFREQHRQFWNLTQQELQKIVPPDKFSPTKEKLTSFAAGYGTLLFFEEWKTVETLQAQFPTYKDNFPIWAYQANAMAEYIVWTSFAEAGIGASLQHYNPLVDEVTKKTFALPASWKLIAQMPFGTAQGEPAEKSFLSLQERVVEK